MEMNIFFDRHESIFKEEISTLAQLTTAVAKKFSELAPELGVNYNDSVFCKYLESFAYKVEAALETDTVDITEEKKAVNA
jgi:hypothetical protein